MLEVKARIDKAQVRLRRQEEEHAQLGKVLTLAADVGSTSQRSLWDCCVNVLLLRAHHIEHGLGQSMRKEDKKEYGCLWTNLGVLLCLKPFAWMHSLVGCFTLQYSQGAGDLARRAGCTDEWFNTTSCITCVVVYSRAQQPGVVARGPE
eukprot:2672922-Amphidinium_carterae.1